jgi:CubicO group peptidase (beta-lactamase class C family)
VRLAGWAAAAVACAATASARDWREGATEALVEERVRPGEPGIAVLVRQDGKTVFARGFGVRDLRSRDRIGSDTSFRLASVTKAFTATAVGLLVRDGMLRYEDTISEVFPAFPAYGRTITIRHLLTHTSGLPDYEVLMETAESGRATPIWTTERQIRDDEVLALLRGETRGRFEPGTRFAYSNSGYVVLGLAVARVSGKPFAHFLQQRIFGPLGMSHSRAYEKGKDEIPRRAFGHTREDGVFREADQSPTSATLGDGGVYSTIEDLAKWDEALRTNELLSPAWTKPALTPARLADGSPTLWPQGDRGDDNLEPGEPVAYGFGWFLDPWRGRSRAWHHGGTRGFKTVIDRFTEDGVTVVVLANRDDLDVRGLALEIAKPYLGVAGAVEADPSKGGPTGGPSSRGARRGRATRDPQTLVADRRRRILRDRADGSPSG